MEGDFKKALKYSFLLLKYRARSKNEVISRLKRKKFSSPITDKVLAYLEEKKYIDDNEFARLFASFRGEKGWGQKKIAFSLKKLGISEDLIKEVLGDRGTFKRKIRELIEEKKNCYKAPERYKKILRLLSSRGFDYDDIQEALRETEIK